MALQMRQELSPQNPVNLKNKHFAGHFLLTTMHITKKYLIAESELKFPQVFSVKIRAKSLKNNVQYIFLE
jgi:hypothetical protein